MAERLDIYFTITGTNFRYGTEFFEKDMTVNLEKEPDNKYDNEAIMVKLPGLGVVGYVANSTRTVVGDCYSAGRLYDKIGDTAKGRVLYILPNGVICRLEQEVYNGRKKRKDFSNNKYRR